MTRPDTFYARSVFVSILLFIQFVAVATSLAEDLPQPQAGSVIAIRGTVTATNGQGQTRTLSIKSPIYVDDSITTAKRGRLQILFKDNSIISLGNDTVTKINDYQWNPDKEEAKLNTEIKEGVFRVMGGLISKKSPEEFKVQTPAATLGIRGSMYSGRVSPEGLIVIFEGGKGIDLTNGAGTVAITRSGDASSASNWNTVISPPSRMGMDLFMTILQPLTSYNAADPSALSPPQGSNGKVTFPVSLSKNEQHALHRQSVTTRVKANPQQASKIVKQAVDNDILEIDPALGAALQGMENIDRQSFDRLINQAIDKGMTVDRARKVVEEFKATGGVCE
ncbi:MAG: FecR domain-containing protein [Desulfobulbaceae bacterium]|nr:FecR domain-containing protein [Desulfobulbaceae bacterium]